MPLYPLKPEYPDRPEAPIIPRSIVISVTEVGVTLTDKLLLSITSML
jgi:hypothetical protein